MRGCKADALGHRVALAECVLLVGLGQSTAFQHGAECHWQPRYCRHTATKADLVLL